MSEGTGEKVLHDLRFDVNESPPLGLAALLAAQTVLLIVAGIVLTPAIVLRGANMPASMEAGVIFFALLISGIITVMQARPVWRIGAGHILLMGTSGAFIAVGITALELGGMPLLMTLIVVSSLFQFALAGNLGLLRRIITPLIGGTTIMLLAVTVMPIAFSHFPAAEPGQAAWPPVAVASVTLLTILGFSFFGSRGLRLWAPVIGIVAGSLASAAFGSLDLQEVRDAAWIGLPSLSWPGFDLSFDGSFWLLLPAFVIVTLVGAIETYGDSIAVQRISNRTAKPVDYRVVQGALYADGLGNLLSGAAGTMPNTTYSTSISVVDMTGVASRRVGVLCGVFMVLLAFFPKIAALILSIPEPVVGSYLVVLILLLFMHGIRMVAADGLTYEKGFIVGMGFWLGSGFQHKAIFPDVIPDWLAPMLGNGMTSGTIVTVLLIWILGLKKGRKRSFETHLAAGSLPEIQAFISSWCKAHSLGRGVANKLQLAVEETMVGLLELRGDTAGAAGKGSDRLRLELRAHDRELELDVAVASIDANLENVMNDARSAGAVSEDKLPFQILRSLVDGFTHFQFHGADFISMSLRGAATIRTPAGIK